MHRSVLLIERSKQPSLPNNRPLNASAVARQCKPSSWAASFIQRLSSLPLPRYDRLEGDCTRHESGPAFPAARAFWERDRLQHEYGYLAPQAA